ncbi:MAG: hypothetical protein ACMUEM_06940 [Flavobacteriales bacterium AspAUS03]
MPTKYCCASIASDCAARTFMCIMGSILLHHAPVVQGHEHSGEVVEIGCDVTTGLIRYNPTTSRPQLV